MQKFRKQKGFTLVELLICMVVIAILAAVFILASKEAVSSAKAARIINNLNILKTAALQWYDDNVGLVENGDFGFLNDYRPDILKYVGNNNIDANYQFSNGDRKLGKEVNGVYIEEIPDNMTWYVWWKYDGNKKVLDKLASRGLTAKLRYTHSNNDWQPSDQYFTEPDYTVWGIGLYVFGATSYKDKTIRYPDSN